jgi:hypothetical protein
MADWMTVGVGFIINLILGTIVLHIAARLAKVDGATIMKAFTAALIAAILVLILGFVHSLGGLIGFILAIVIIKYVYATSWGKAIFTWILYIILMIVIAFVLGLIIGTTYLALT